MTTRELPRDEWAKLAHTELGPALAWLPANTRVVVVETLEPRPAIVGCWAVMQYVHVEGLWIDPGYRKTGRTLHRLGKAMRRVVEALGSHVALTAALDGDHDIERLLMQHGAAKLPGTTYVLPMEKIGCRR